MTKELTAAAFDYSSVEKDVKGKLINLAGVVKRHTLKFKESGDEIGQAISEAHKLLADQRKGLFELWVECETEIGVSTAYNLKNIWERGSDFPIIGKLPPTVAYMMAAPGTPPEAIKEIEKAISKGARPTVELAKTTLDKFREVQSRPKAQPRPKKLPSQSDEPPTPAEDKPPPVKQFKDTFDPSTFESGLDLAAKQAPYGELLNYLTQARTIWNRLTADERDGCYLADKKNRVDKLFDELRGPIAQAAPMAVCSKCSGKGCDRCRHCGWWPRSVVEGMTK